MIKKRLSAGLRIHAAVLSFVCAEILYSGMTLFAQTADSVFPQTSRASLLFSAAQSDSDTEILAQGLWSASIMSSGKFSFGSAPFSFSPVPILFTQRPDLYIFARYKKKWLFETYVTQNLSDVLYRISFIGSENDFVRWARVGNAGIIMDDYPFMAFGAPKGSIGIAIAAGKDITMDAMLRWDSLAWRSLVRIGGAELLEESVSSKAMIRGRRFVFPKSDTPLRNVILRDTIGSTARTLLADEYALSMTDGIVLLAEEPKGALTAEYTAYDGTHKLITLYHSYRGTDGKLVREGSRYEFLGLYSLRSGADALFVRNMASAQSDMRFTVSRVNESLVEVRRNGVAPDAVDEYTKPFYDYAPWLYMFTAEGMDAFTIVGRRAHYDSAIRLEQGAVPGTISVYRDGTLSQAFSFDSASSVVTLMPEARPGERIEIRYAITSAQRSDGALTFGLGTRFTLFTMRGSAAIGGRWPVFGAGFDTAGRQQAAWTGLSLGLEKEDTWYAFRAAAMARYDKASVSGIYRIADMQEKSPSFALVQGSGIDMSIEKAEDLASAPAFASMFRLLHANPAANTAMKIQSSSTTPLVRIVRYTDDVPFASYKRLAFFIKREDKPCSDLTLRIGDGNGNGASLRIPIAGLSESLWYKIELDLSPLPSARIISKDGTVSPLTVEVSYTPPSFAGRIDIELADCNSGVVYIDELVLESGRDGFSGLGTVYAAVHSSDGYGPYAKLSAFGIAARNSSAASKLKAGWIDPLLFIELEASPSYSAGVFSSGFGYTIALPSPRAPTRLVDSFSWDSGRCGKRLEAVLSEHDFAAQLSGALSESDSTLRQAWEGSFAWKKNIELAAGLSLYAPGSSSDLLDSWRRSWELLFIAADSGALSRSMKASLSLYEASLTCEIRHEYRSAAPSVSSLNARLGYPFSIGHVVFTPYYTRRSLFEKPSVSHSFKNDLRDFGGAAFSLGPLWGAIPWYELWAPREYTKFIAHTGAAIHAAHESESGFELKRPLGYGIVDIFAPSSVRLSYTRVMEKKADTLSDAGITRLSMGGAAVLIFGQGGVKPMLRSVIFDEYSYGLAMSFTRYSHDGMVLPSIDAKGAMSFETTDSYIVSLSSKTTYAKTRSAEPWSCGAAVSLSYKAQSTWLGKLSLLAMSAAQTSWRKKERSWVSLWLDSLMNGGIAMRDTFQFDAYIGRQAEIRSPLLFRFAFDYLTSVLASDALSVSAGLGVWTEALFFSETKSLAWNIGYKISLELKIMF